MHKGLIYISLILLMFTACHSTKNVVSKTDIKQLEVSSLYDSLKTHYGDYSTVSFKFDIESKEIKSLPIQIKGSMRIKKDSIIWISIAPTMNIEVLRCVLTKDSVKCYSKLQKTYYASSLDSITKLVGFDCDYQTIQSILLNELFFCDQNEKTDTLAVLKTFETNIKNNSAIIKAHSKKEFKKNEMLSLQQIWTIDNTIFRISDVEIKNDNVAENSDIILRLHYGNFQKIENIDFPMMISMKAKNPRNKISMDLNFNKITFNEDLSFPFNVSSSYQKMDLK